MTFPTAGCLSPSRKWLWRVASVPRWAGISESLFGEDQACYVIAVPRDAVERIVADAKAALVMAFQAGMTGGDKIAVHGHGEIALSKLRKAHESWFPAYMGGEEIPPQN